MSAKQRAHDLAWKLGLDVMPVGAESRAMAGMAAEDVARLQGVVQRVFGYSRDVGSFTPPIWSGLVAEAFALASQGKIPRGQLLQDAWVLWCTGRMSGGYFVEIGAADGYYLSNTVLLESEFGWSGLLCEPNPLLREAINRVPRSGSVVVPEAVWDRSGDTMDLVLADEMSAFTDQADHDVHARGRRASSHGNRVQVRTITPSDLLLREGSPEVIDYLSVDTEGSELEILSVFPWDTHQVRLLTVEHNHRPGRAAAFDQLLIPHGFRRVLADWSGFDAWYAHESVVLPPGMAASKP